MGHIPPFDTQPSSAPIYQTTAFDVPDLNVLADLHTGAAKGHIYTRDSNPNRQALAESIASLENAEAGGTFSSGMGAIAAISMTLAAAGDHIIVGQSLYGITLKLMSRLQKRFGIDVSYVDVTTPAEVIRAVKDNTRFCLIETNTEAIDEIRVPLVDIERINLKNLPPRRHFDDVKPLWKDKLLKEWEYQSDRGAAVYSQVVLAEILDDTMYIRARSALGT